jgi:hypothetical protein
MSHFSPIFSCGVVLLRLDPDLDPDLEPGNASGSCNISEAILPSKRL